MARKDKPINADVPRASTPADAPAPPVASTSADPGAPPVGTAGAEAERRRRRAVPAALKAIAGLVVIAVVFIVAAILGGGGENGGSIPGAAPAPETATTTSTTPAVRAPAESEPDELGYPGFATNNTTRVGGGDPASNAAAVALAAYPSQAPPQRPVAVTIVNAADWQTAVAASVLMAAPLRAPLLIAEGDELPDPSAAALEMLDPRGGRASDGAQVFAIGGAVAPPGVDATEVPATGAAGAAAVAALRDRLLGGPPRHVVVAATDPAFAAPAAAWAARSGDPVLFTERDRLPIATAKALKRSAGARVFVLGPSSQVSSDVVRRIAKVAGRVRRVSGEDPVSSAIALARYESGDFGWDVNDPGHGFVVARSDSPLDAVAAAPLSGSGTWGPLLLTDSADTLPPAVRDYLLDVKPGYTNDPTRAFYNHVWVIGDPAAISVAEQAEIDQLAELARIGGEP
jgi:hypothetical protein